MQKVFRKACEVVSAVKYTKSNTGYFLTVCRKFGMNCISVQSEMSPEVIVIEFCDMVPPARAIRKETLFQGQYLVQYESGCFKIVDGADFETQYQIAGESEEYYRSHVRGLEEELDVCEKTVDALRAEIVALKKQFVTLPEGDQ